MARLTVQAIQSQAARRLAESIIYFDASRSPHDYARAVRNFITSHVVIVDEFEELLQGPDMLLQRIEQQGRAYGDCDDVAMLGAALLASMGALVRFRAIEQNPDGSFGHVYVEYSFPKDTEWYYFDCTINGPPLFQGASITKDVIS